MKLRAICKSKIHRARITGADLNYVGSIAIDGDLMARTDIVPGEKVSVWNVTNGERIETYALPAPAGSGDVIVNGAAARRFHQDDIVIIAAFALTDEVVHPRMIAVDERNAFLHDLTDNAREEVGSKWLGGPRTTRTTHRAEPTPTPKGGVDS